MPRAQEQAHLGFTKAVDGLHRIAHHKQRAPVIGRPAGGEALQQLVLRERGVLEFIDQDVMDAVVKRQQEVGGRVFGAQGEQRALRDLDKVGLAAQGEHQLEFGHGARQQAGDGTKRGPLLGTVMRGRHQLHVDQGGAQVFKFT